MSLAEDLEASENRGAQTSRSNNRRVTRYVIDGNDVKDKEMTKENNELLRDLIKKIQVIEDHQNETMHMIEEKNKKKDRITSWNPHNKNEERKSANLKLLTDTEEDGTPAHELIFLHSKSSIFSDDAKHERMNASINSQTNKIDLTESRLLDMSMQGSMIGNFLIKKAHEEID